MIPFIRSLSELMAITEARDNLQGFSKYNEVNDPLINSGQKERNMKSIRQDNIYLSDLRKKEISKWKRNKSSISNFLGELDYNNQIQSSYEITLITRQNDTNQQEVA